MNCIPIVIRSPLLENPKDKCKQAYILGSVLLVMVGIPAPLSGWFRLDE
jgi:hypothetical protein